MHAVLEEIIYLNVSEELVVAVVEAEIVLVLYGVKLYKQCQADLYNSTIMR